MSKLPHREPIGGTVAHIGDCYVWAEIYYLDSPTDYRELLPNVKPLPLPLGGGLVMLDMQLGFRRLWSMRALVALSWLWWLS